MTAPRIDKVRSDIASTIRMLQEASDQLEDLHVLAYYRHKAASTERVRGGSRDYALDTHGDPEARRLYAALANDIRTTNTRVKATITDARSFMTEHGSSTGRRDPSGDATVDEVIEALDAVRRRRTRMEYTPAKLVDQPVVMSQTEWRNECEALRSAVAKITSEFAGDHQLCQSMHVDRRGQRPKLLRRYPTKVLSPRERDAWRRANQSVSDPDTEKAS